MVRFGLSRMLFSIDPESAGRCAALADAERVLAKMPATPRLCWKLRQLNWLSYEVITSSLDVTPVVVRCMLSGARLLIASELAHWHLSPTAG